MGLKSGATLWFWIGLAIVTAVIAAKEIAGAPHFADDDNLTQFLPVIERGAAYFFRTGRLPMWNPFGQMGAPTYAIGTYALAYPVTYLSFAIAAALGNIDATLDVFVTLHFAAGYVGFYLLCRALQVRASIAALAALTWIVCSIPGASGWYYMAPVLTFGPWTLWALLTAKSRKPWVTVAVLGALWGLFGLSGNIQMLIYTAMFWWAALVLFVADRAITIRTALAAASGFFLGAAITSFVVVPGLIALADIVRHGKAGYVLPLGELKAFLIPEPFVAPPTLVLQENPRYGGIWFYMPVLAVVGTWSTLAVLLARRLPIATLLNDTKVLGILGLIAVILACGPAAGLWSFLAMAPKFNQFQHAAKFLWPAILLLTLCGAIAADRLLKSRAALLGLFALSLLAMIVPLITTAGPGKPDDGHYTDRGYPQLPDDAARLIHSGGRVFAVAPARSHLPNPAWGQALAFSTAYGVMNASGYDPLVAALPEGRAMMAKLDALHKGQPLDVLRNVGVRWVVVHRAAYDPPVTLDWDELYDMGRFMPGVFGAVTTLPEAFRNHDISIYQLDHPMPMACALPCRTDLPISVDEGGLTISLPAGRHDVEANFLYRRGMHALVDGRPIAMESDRLGRIRIRGANGHTLTILQTQPWALAWLAAAAMLIIAGAFYLTGTMRFSYIPK